jgi:hypothetical protein
MAVISGNDYSEIAQAYADSRDSILGGKQGLYDAVYLIVLLQVIKPEVDLLSTFWDTYQVQLNTLEASTLFLSAVRALNQHVLVEGGYATIDAFLLATGITVPQTWADLSAEAGYTISDTYIVG